MYPKSAREFSESSTSILASDLTDIGDPIILNAYADNNNGNAGGFSRVIAEIRNTSTQALADFRLLVKPHADGEWVTTKTGSGWGTPDTFLLYTFTTINTLAASTSAIANIFPGAVHAVKFQAQSAATTVLSNGTFTGNATGWTAGSGWSYGTNNVAATTASSTFKQAKASMGTPWTDGLVYEVGFTISSYSAGSLKIGTNTTPAQYTISADGTYTGKLITADAHSDGLVFTGVGFTGVIDSVTARLVSGVTVRGGLFR
jgi:hypothetical protein